MDLLPHAFFVVFVLTTFIHLRGAMRPTNKQTIAKAKRKLKGTPVLCYAHSKGLKLGQMAVIDQKRCQRCKKQA